MGFRGAALTLFKSIWESKSSSSSPINALKYKVNFTTLKMNKSVLHIISSYYIQTKNILFHSTVLWKNPLVTLFQNQINCLIEAFQCALQNNYQFWTIYKPLNLKYHNVSSITCDDTHSFLKIKNTVNLNQKSFNFDNLLLTHSWSDIYNKFKE